MKTTETKKKPSTKETKKVAKKTAASSISIEPKEKKEVVKTATKKIAKKPTEKKVASKKVVAKKEPVKKDAVKKEISKKVLVKKDAVKKEKTKGTIAKKTVVKKDKVSVPKTAVKKATVKKTTTTSAKKVKTDNALWNELEKLVMELDKNDITFIINQARVLVQNKYIREDSQALNALKKPMKTPKDTSIRFEYSAASGAGHLTINNMPKVLDTNELKTIINISISNDPLNTKLETMYQWLKRERNDFLIDVGITSPHSKTLELLVKFFNEKYNNASK